MSEEQQAKFPPRLVDDLSQRFGMDGDVIASILRELPPASLEQSTEEKVAYIRLPLFLHHALRKRAKINGQSINDLCRQLVINYLTDTRTD